MNIDRVMIDMIGYKFCSFFQTNNKLYINDIIGKFHLMTQIFKRDFSKLLNFIIKFLYL